MAVIKTKTPNFTGYRASVFFRNGVGSTDDTYLIEWFKSHGYDVEDEPKTEPKMTEAPVVRGKTKPKNGK